MDYDGAYEWSTVLLAAAQARLTDAGVPAARVFLEPGATAVWDTCCIDDGREGQLWVATTQVYPATGQLTPDTQPVRCQPSGFAADLIVGVLRCAHTLDDQGNPPTVEQVTADAEKVARDRTLIRDAILCDAGPRLDVGGYRLGGWVPLGPQGGCVGGQWTLTIALPSCPCEEH